MFKVHKFFGGNFFELFYENNFSVYRMSAQVLSAVNLFRCPIRILGTFEKDR